MSNFLQDLSSGKANKDYVDRIKKSLIKDEKMQRIFYNNVNQGNTKDFENRFINNELKKQQEMLEDYHKKFEKQSIKNKQIKNENNFQNKDKDKNNKITMYIAGGFVLLLLIK